jgi:hypothetical protein
MTPSRSRAFNTVEVTQIMTSMAIESFYSLHSHHDEVKRYNYI